MRNLVNATDDAEDALVCQRHRNQGLSPAGSLAKLSTVFVFLESPRGRDLPVRQDFRGRNLHSRCTVCECV